MLGAGLLAAIAFIIAIPAFSLLLLTLAARRRSPLSPTRLAPGDVPRVAILVPAHNESGNVLPTIACLLPQLQRDDRLLVVADNCNDAHPSRET